MDTAKSSRPNVLEDGVNQILIPIKVTKNENHQMQRRKTSNDKGRSEQEITESKALLASIAFCECKESSTATATASSDGGLEGRIIWKTKREIINQNDTKPDLTNRYLILSVN